MAPAAEMLGVDAAALAENYVAALPTARRIYQMQRNLDMIWTETCKHLKRTHYHGWKCFEPLAELTALTLIMKPATLKLESNFSHLEAFSSERQAGTCIDCTPMGTYTEKNDCKIIKAVVSEGSRGHAKEVLCCSAPLLFYAFAGDPGVLLPRFHFV